MPRPIFSINFQANRGIKPLLHIKNSRLFALSSSLNIMNTAIIGASGYSGEELVRLLSQHPDVTLAAVASRSLVGKPVAEVMPTLKHLVGDLKFSTSDPEDLAIQSSPLKKLFAS